MPKYRNLIIPIILHNPVMAHMSVDRVRIVPNDSMHELFKTCIRACLRSLDKIPPGIVRIQHADKCQDKFLVIREGTDIDIPISLQAEQAAKCKGEYEK